MELRESVFEFGKDGIDAGVEIGPGAPEIEPCTGDDDGRGMRIDIGAERSVPNPGCCGFNTMLPSRPSGCRYRCYMETSSGPVNAIPGTGWPRNRTWRWSVTLKKNQGLPPRGEMIRAAPRAKNLLLRADGTWRN